LPNIYGLEAIFVKKLKIELALNPAVNSTTALDHVFPKTLEAPTRVLHLCGCGSQTLFR